MRTYFDKMTVKKLVLGAIVAARTVQANSELVSALEDRVAEGTSELQPSIAVLRGVAEGLGIDPKLLKRRCVDAPGLHEQVEDSIARMMKKTEIDMENGLRDLGLILSTALSKSLRACGLSRAEVGETV